MKFLQAVAGLALLFPLATVGVVWPTGKTSPEKLLTALGGKEPVTDEDPDLHKRLRGMEDGDNGWRFGWLLRAVGGKEPVTDEDPDLHKRLRGMEDGDSRWRFGRHLRALGGKEPVAEQDDVSLKESCTLVLLESDWTCP
jgi:hypothetical protein